MVCCAANASPVYLGLSRGVCRECRQMSEVRYVAIDDKVYLERHCPEHGISRALVAESLAWYLDALKAPMAPVPPRTTIPRNGACPKACGPCEFHAQACHLPVFSITNACNLRCPICFTYNRADEIYTMSPEAFGRHIDFVVEATGGVDLINITGGEPTLHPQLTDLLAKARRPEIGRVTVNSNGIALGRDPDLVRRLADLGVYVILSVDTLDPDLCTRIHGRDVSADKKAALESLERFGVPTTLLMVLIGGVNEKELLTLLDLLRQHDFVRSLTIQTMTYTGQGGGTFMPRQHLPVDAVERRIEEATGGAIKQSDFMPLPTAHPLCYGICYLATDAKGSVHPFSRILDPQTLATHLSQGYLLHPSDALEVQLKEAIDRIWSEEGDPALLATLKEMLRQIYPVSQSLGIHQRQQRAERMVKTIYVHAHMDEDTYEVGRAMRCPDQVPVHAERLVGACNYNLFYRQKDERFWVEL